jgi:molecular chaperone GrpE
VFAPELSAFGGVPGTRAASTASQPGSDPEPPAPAPGAGTPAPDVPPERSEQERWRQAARELEAAKARVVRDAERARQETRTELVSKLFPVLDGLDRSLASESGAHGFVEGVKLVREELERVLSDFGVERIDAVGQPFDPQQHEAVDVVAVDTSAEHHRVVEEWEAGYRHAGRVLRPAKVRVGRYDR